jgi:hypothetical protein
MIRDFFYTPPCTMIATAPQTVAPAVDLEQTIQKKPLPAVPRRGPEAGFHHIHYDFHGLWVNPISSCSFLQNTEIVCS